MQNIEEIIKDGLRWGFPMCCIQNYIDILINKRLPAAAYMNAKYGKDDANYVKCVNCRRIKYRLIDEEVMVKLTKELGKEYLAQFRRRGRRMKKANVDRSWEEMAEIIAEKQSKKFTKRKENFPGQNRIEDMEREVTNLKESIHYLKESLSDVVRENVRILYYILEKIGRK